LWSHRVALLTLSVAVQTSVAAQAPPALRIAESLRLDANTEDFSTVREVEVSPSGLMALVQPQDLAIGLYSAAGKRIATVGRRGRGPGEFIDINRLGWHTDSLWVWDYAQRRIVWFDKAGKHLRSAATPATLTVTGQVGVASLMDVYSVSSNGAIRGVVGIADPASGRPGAPTRYIATVSATGAVKLQARPPQYEDSRYMLEVGEMMARVPFAGMPHITGNAAGSRVLIVTSDQTAPSGGTFTITLLGSGSDTILHRTRPANGAPIPQRSIDSALASLGRTRNADGAQATSRLGAAMVAEARKRIPAVYPGATLGRIGVDGVLAVLRGGPGIPRTYMLFDERGALLGEFTLPVGSVLRQVSRTTAWTTMADSDGLTSVVRYAISGQSAGGL